MARRTLLLLAAAAAGAALVVAGCLVPEILLYLAGVCVVAIAVAVTVARGVRRRGRAWFVVVLVVLVAVGVAVPWLAARHVERDIAWRTDTAGPTVIDGDRLVVAADDGRIHVLDAATGEEQWTTPGDGPVISANGDVLAYSYHDRTWHRLDRSGHERWRADLAPSRDPGYLRGITMTDSATVTTWCRSDIVSSPSRCVVSAVGPDGKELWSHAYARAATGEPVDLMPNRSTRAPSALALRVAAHGRSMLLLVDPDTGRALRTVRLPSAYAGALVVTQGDRVVAATRNCTLSAFDARGRRMWAAAYEPGCPRSSYPPVGASVREVYPGRLYLSTTGAVDAVVTIDLSDGRSRHLDPADYEGDGLEEEHFGPDVVVREDVTGDGPELVVHDAATGDELWRRQVDLDDEAAARSEHLDGVVVDDSIVVVERAHIPNPFLRPGIDTGRGWHLVTDRSRRLVVLDRRTGREVASAVDGSAGVTDLAMAIGDGFAVVHHDERSYRVG